METTMKNIVITAILASTIATTAMSDTVEYTFTPTHMIEPTVECTNTDLAIGIVAGVAIAVAAGVATMATLPVSTSAGVATGATVGWSGALSAPFLTNGTATMVASSLVIAGPVTSTVGYYATCITRTMLGN
jgi:hypothetical protein